jgi:A/G-specific adenine glycosylase
MHKKSRFSRPLLKWFKTAGRDFPWRETNDPYKILIAEKLLQQTSVRKALIDLYLYLVEKYPTPNLLADADFQELTNLVQPLGLHYRAKDLILMAKDIKEKFSGIVPDDLKSLLLIYGVGDYSARAVLSFAYGHDVAVVDTNIARILYRVFAIPGKFPQNPARKRQLLELAAELVPANKSKEFNWAMIDLGALICVPSNPLCDKCPLNNICMFNLQRESGSG